MMSANGIVIVGGGLAGQLRPDAAQSAATTDRSGWSAPGRILPYDRPPLSKGLLAGTVREEDVLFRPLELV